MPLHDFRCEGGHTRERLVSAGTSAVPCFECGASAERVYGARAVPSIPDPERVILRQFMESADVPTGYGEFDHPTLYRHAADARRQLGRLG